MEDFAAALAATVQMARTERGLTVAALAEASGVSRAMISKVERGEAQPTAALLARLSGSLGLTLSELISRAEGDAGRLRRRDEQPTWIDPETGYTRRSLSPAASAALELVEVELPAGATVTYPAEAYRFIDQQIWMLEGTLRFAEAEQVHELHAGDCLQLGAPATCTFENRGRTACRYLIALNKLPASRRGQ